MLARRLAMLTAMPLPLVVVFGLALPVAALQVTSARVNRGTVDVVGRQAVPNAAISWEGHEVTQASARGAFRFSTDILPPDCVGGLSDGTQSVQVVVQFCGPQGAPGLPGPPGPPGTPGMSSIQLEVYHADSSLGTAPGSSAVALCPPPELAVGGGVSMVPYAPFGMAIVTNEVARDKDSGAPIGWWGAAEQTYPWPINDPWGLRVSVICAYPATH